jgi:hypothetical protein
MINEGTVETITKKNTPFWLLISEALMSYFVGS